MSFGGTEFVSFCAPPGSTLDSYKRTLVPSSQPSSIPSVFIDAMTVREEVFVREQNVPLENEYDEDDARSFHWVVYASVGSSPTSNTDNGEELSRQTSTATKVPVGTIRLVPPPHRHPEATDPPSAPLSHPSEPYCKVGRLATLAPYRGLGLSKLLINAAFQWASTHAKDVLPPLDPAEAEKRKLEGGETVEEQKWKGIVVAHAQIPVKGVWERAGFVLDESMGKWDEEGMKHLGMVRRLDVREQELK